MFARHGIFIYETINLSRFRLRAVTSLKIAK
nr:MAG TPA: hypothetical protein [Crassvirales sp.]